MAINVSVQYNGGFLPDMILLAERYYHWGTRLNAMKRPSDVGTWVRISMQSHKPGFSLEK